MSEPTVLDLICSAIRTRSLLAFDYAGLPRVVAPYCHGYLGNGKECLRAVQVAGKSKSGLYGAGKLWLGENMVDLRVLPTTFIPDDPNYNPDDRMIPRIHCRI